MINLAPTSPDLRGSSRIEFVLVIDDATPGSAVGQAWQSAVNECRVLRVARMGAATDPATARLAVAPICEPIGVPAALGTGAAAVVRDSAPREYFASAFFPGARGVTRPEADEIEALMRLHNRPLSRTIKRLPRA